MQHMSKVSWAGILIEKSPAPLSSQDQQNWFIATLKLFPHGNDGLKNKWSLFN